MNHTKIAVIGAGAVGTASACALMWKGVAAEIVLIDIDEKRCRGEILDLSDALPFCCTSAIKQGSFKDAADANIIIIAAGARQKPGQSRLELVQTNWKIIKSILHEIGTINPSSIVLMVTNPVDIMAYCAQQFCNLPKTQVFGSGTWLDSQRICGLVAQKIGVAEQSIQAYMLGEHGDSQFAAWSSAYVGGVAVKEFPGITESDLQKFEEITKKRAYEIIECKDATYYGIGACVANICENIVFNQRRVMPVSCYIKELDACLSMPTIIGGNGIDRIVPIPLSTSEKDRISASGKTLREIISQCPA